MTLKSLLIATTLLLTSQLSLALTLDEARSQGLLGENTRGYVELTPRGKSDAEALMTEINSQRKARYLEIATKQKTELTAIEKIAGEKIIEKLNAGEFYKDSNGTWHKR